MYARIVLVCDANQARRFFPKLDGNDASFIIKRFRTGTGCSRGERAGCVRGGHGMRETGKGGRESEPSGCGARKWTL